MPNPRATGPSFHFRTRDINEKGRDNGSRYARSGVLVGRDNAALPEPIPSHAKCLTARHLRLAYVPVLARSVTDGRCPREVCSVYHGDLSDTIQVLINTS